MNEIKIFSNEQFGQVRIAINESNEPLFCLADVCMVLDLTPSKVVQRLDKDVLSKYPLETAGGIQQANFVNEDGLYDAILDSRKLEAKQFRKWVTSEILPSIRKSGGYMVSRQDETPEEVMARALNIAQDTLKRRDERISQLEQQKSEDAPKVLFTKAVEGSRNSCLVGELAKLITQAGHEIGQNRLFKWFRDNGYFGKIGERYNIPNQQFVEQGLFELKKGIRSGDGGVLITTITPKITGKGQVYFLNKLLEAVE